MHNYKSWVSSQGILRVRTVQGNKMLETFEVSKGDKIKGKELNRR
jgi:hypothetical protein